MNEPAVQYRAEWYQVLYNIAVQHAHRTLVRADDLAHVVQRFPREATNGGQVLTSVLELVLPALRDDRAPEYAAVADMLDALTTSKKVLLSALDTVPKLHRGEGPLSQLRLRTLLQFLEETVEPTTALLLVGLATRPEFRIWRVAFEWPAGLTEEAVRDWPDPPAPWHPARADAFRTSLSGDLESDRIDATALLRFALSAPRSYRADYNLACLLAGHIAEAAGRVAAGLAVLERALRRAPVAEQISLANWADADPSLMPLRQAHATAFSELLARYRPPSIEPARLSSAE